MRRRDFIAALGGAAATWPLAARAQQRIPLIGYLSGISVGDRAHLPEAFRQGLNEVGYIEGRNVIIEYRSANNQMDRLRPLATELIDLKVDNHCRGWGKQRGLGGQVADLDDTNPLH